MIVWCIGAYQPVEVAHSAAQQVQRSVGREANRGRVAEKLRQNPLDELRHVERKSGRATHEQLRASVGRVQFGRIRVLPLSSQQLAANCESNCAESMMVTLSAAL